MFANIAMYLVPLMSDFLGYIAYVGSLCMSEPLLILPVGIIVTVGMVKMMVGWMIAIG